MQHLTKCVKIIVDNSNACHAGLLFKPTLHDHRILQFLFKVTIRLYLKQMYIIYTSTNSFQILNFEFGSTMVSPMSFQPTYPHQATWEADFQ